MQTTFTIYGKKMIKWVKVEKAEKLSGHQNFWLIIQHTEPNGIKKEYGYDIDISQTTVFKMKLIREYNENTTLHGLKYTTEYGRNILERMMWGMVVLVAMIFGIYLTSKILTKWETSPIIISLDSASHPISEIPFPAVTICPTVKGIKEKVISEVCKRG